MDSGLAWPSCSRCWRWCMAWTPFLDVVEEGEVEAPLPEAAHLPVVKGEPPLNPRWRILLSHLYDSKNLREAAEAAGMTYKYAQRVVTEPAFKRAVEVQDQAFIERVSRGEFGAMAVAKTNLVKNLNALQALANTTKNDRVKHAVLVDLIKFAGFQPPKPQVTESPERIIDQMTGEEAEHFANTGEWPTRLRDQVARLPMSALHQTRDPEVVIGEVIPRESPQPEESLDDDS